MARLRVARPRRQRRGAATATIDQKSSHGVAQPAYHMETVMDLGRDRPNSFTVSLNHDELVTDLQEAWPSLKLALAVLKISCTLNLDEGSMTVCTTTRTRNPSIFAKAMSLLELLASGVPAFKAIKVLKRNTVHKIINIGFQEGGLCSKFGITEKQFLRRRKGGLDATQLKAIYDYTGCEMFVHGDTVAAIGPSPQILEVAMWAVEGCIVRKLLPSHRLKGFFKAVSLRRQVKKLSALRI